MQPTTRFSSSALHSACKYFLFSLFIVGNLNYLNTVGYSLQIYSKLFGFVITLVLQQYNTFISKRKSNGLKILLVGSLTEPKVLHNRRKVTNQLLFNQLFTQSLSRISSVKTTMSYLFRNNQVLIIYLSYYLFYYGSLHPVYGLEAKKCLRVLFKTIFKVDNP